MKKLKFKEIALLSLFCLLYIAVAFVSLYHAIAFFELANESWLAIILAVTFEIGQAGVLFSILTGGRKRVLPWILMSVLTIVQVFGNVFSSYKYMIINNMDQIPFFSKSILFFVQNPNPEYNYVLISYIIGAILPIVALCMTTMVASYLGTDDPEPEKMIDEPKIFDNSVNDSDVRIL